METLRVALRAYVDFEKALKSQTASFRALHPEAQFEIVPMELETLYRELMTDGGLRSGQWDMALLITDWLPEAIAGGMLEELTPHLAERPIPDWPQAWPRSLEEPLNFGGRYYSIPWHDGPECLMYRRDWFAAAENRAAFRRAYGYELAPPRTWEQFEDVARFFTKPEEGLWGTAFAGYPDGHNTLYDFSLQVWSRGGELHDASGLPTLATREAEVALDYYRRVVRDATICHPESAEFDSVRAGQLFMSGSVAMMVNWFGFAASGARPGAPLEGRVSLAPIPCSAGQSPVSLSAFWSFAMASGSTKKAMSWEFLRYLAQPEMDLEAVRHGVVGVRLSTWRDPAVQRAIPAFAEIEEISLSARRLPRTPSLPQFAEIINAVVERSLDSDEPSAAILERAQQQAAEKRIRFV